MIRDAIVPIVVGTAISFGTGFLVGQQSTVVERVADMQLCTAQLASARKAMTSAATAVNAAKEEMQHCGDLLDRQAAVIRRCLP